MSRSMLKSFFSLLGMIFKRLLFVFQNQTQNLCCCQRFAGHPRLEGKFETPPKVEHAFLAQQRERLEVGVPRFFFLKMWG